MTNTLTLPEPEAEAAPAPASGARQVRRRLLARKSALAAAAVLGLLVLLALGAPLLAALEGQDPNAYHDTLVDSARGGVPFGGFGGISAEHWLGVEPGTGRDLFVRLLYGARISLTVALGATLVQVVVGVAVGLGAALGNRFTDSLLSHVTDVMVAMPLLVFAIALVAVVPADFPRPVLLVVAIGLLAWGGMARLVRAQTLSLKKLDFVSAARLTGGSSWRIARRELLPSLAAPVITYAAILLPTNIVLEASMSFLGVGVKPPTPSWGADALHGHHLVPRRPPVRAAAGADAVRHHARLHRPRRRGARGARPARGVPAARRQEQAHVPYERRGRRTVTGYFLRRALGAVVVVLVLSAVVYATFYIAPGDPARLGLRPALQPRTDPPGPRAAPAQRPGVRAVLALPAGDRRRARLLHRHRRAALRRPPCFGLSYQNNQQVTDLIIQRLPATASLATGAMAVWLLLGTGTGLLSALRRGGATERVLTWLTLAGTATPVFISGLGLLMLFCAYLEWLPFPSYVPLTDDPEQWAWNMLLPWAALGLLESAKYARLTRSSMLETLAEDHIRTFRAYGIAERSLIGRHALRGALAPVIALSAADFGSMFGNAMLTEMMFGLPGIGQLLVTSTQTIDLPVVVAVVMVTGTAVVIANIAADVLYAVADRRVALR
ncbi:hypothetical protein GCM10020000_27790 [Streptomyces olivoverticillatus]